MKAAYERNKVPSTDGDEKPLYFLASGAKYEDLLRLLERQTVTIICFWKILRWWVMVYPRFGHYGLGCAELTHEEFKELQKKYAEIHFSGTY